MKSIVSLFFTFALTLVTSFSTIELFAVADSDPQRPNIILIMSDDMGYSDIGCYGGEIDTPTLDKLAKGGLRFTQFYNTGRCCPTRASLLTGLYPHQAGIGWMMSDQGLDGYRGELNRRCVTIAEVLGAGGYATYMTGKWHVTKHTQPKDDAKKFNWPKQRGFDRYYGIINGASSLWDPNSLVRGNELITIFSDEGYKPNEPYHFTDAISDNAVKFIKGHDAARPFFLYVSYTAAHWPMHARQRDIQKYAGKYDSGYDQIRRARYAKMKSLGLISDQTGLTSTVGNWDKVKNKKWETSCMEVYAAMIDQMDQGIGRIVQQLEEGGQLDNTLIMFLQDNGGCAEGAGRDPNPKKTQPRAEQPTLPEIQSDDQYLVYRQGLTLNPSEPPVWLEMLSTMPTDDVETLCFDVEAKANTSGLTQTVEFFNYDTGAFETVSVETAGLADKTIVVEATGDASRFIAGDGTVKTKVTWKATGPVFTFPWRVSIDQALWRFIQ